MCTIKYTAVFFMLWAFISAGGPGHLIKTHGIMDSIKYQQIKNQYVIDSVWIFQLYNNPNTNLKNNTKMGHWAQNQASAMAILVLWPEPCRKWVGSTEEKKHQHGAENLKDLEWFWMKEWSLISCFLLVYKHNALTNANWTSFCWKK